MGQGQRGRGSGCPALASPANPAATCCGFSSLAGRQFWEAWSNTLGMLDVGCGNALAAQDSFEMIAAKNSCGCRIKITLLVRTPFLPRSALIIIYLLIDFTHTRRYVVEKRAHLFRA